MNVDTTSLSQGSFQSAIDQASSFSLIGSNLLGAGPAHSGLSSRSGKVAGGLRLIEQVSDWTEPWGQTATPVNRIDQDALLTPSLGNQLSSLSPNTSSDGLLRTTAQNDNTLDRAQNIGVLDGEISFRDRIDRGDPYDYYRFELTETEDFNLTFGNLSAYATVALLNQNGEVISSGNGSSRSNGYISRTLSAGEYYVRATQFFGNTDYQLTLSTELRPDDSVGNSAARALDLGVLNNTITLEEQISSADPSDYYRFELEGNSRLLFDVESLSESYYLTLLDSKQQEIRRWYVYDPDGEANVALNAGTYYLKFEQFLGSSSYSMNLGVLMSDNPDYSLISGSGLVDAAAAVAASLDQPAFETIPPLSDPVSGPASWGNDLIQAPEVWNQGYTGQGVVVAVIDTGIDFTHSDLDDNIWFNSGEIAGNGIDDDGNGYIDDVSGWDFVDQDAVPQDTDGHGTHVAGTIAAENNGDGATGVAFDAKLMPIRVLGNYAPGSDRNLALGIRYAVDNGAQVINLSLGGDVPLPETEAALEYAQERGVFVVIAAGNDALEGDTQPDFPARYATRYGIAVGAVNSNRRIAPFSNPAGDNSELAYVMAPGVDVYSTLPNERYGRLGGTSMAAPHVAGVVALMLSANPDLSPQLIRSILTGTAVAL